MIYSVFTDRLANNLFQFSAAISLDSNVIICIPDKSEFNKISKYKDIFFKGYKIINSVPDGIKTYDEPYFNFKKIEYVKNTDIVLKGYFQSFKYINRKKILRQFSVDKNSLEFINNKFPFILENNYTSIHVRRGDYMKMMYNHPFCGLTYYKNAVECIGENEKFIVVSDDIKWCKEHLKFKNIIFVENSSPVIDLFIQSLCQNNIISNSSFSWWGAFLNNNPGKKVIAPANWFGFKKKYNTSDLIPRNWKIIDNYSFSILFRSHIQNLKNKIIKLSNN